MTQQALHYRQTRFFDSRSSCCVLDIIYLLVVKKECFSNCYHYRFIYRWYHWCIIEDNVRLLQEPVQIQVPFLKEDSYGSINE